LSDGLLAGVTRRLLFSRVAPAAGMNLVERALRPEDLGQFQECFATSSTQDVAPVACVGRQQFALGAATWTRRLKAAFREYVEAYNTTHPEYRVG
jgi:branched-chain amino acid aminotransferase